MSKFHVHVARAIVLVLAVSSCSKAEDTRRPAIESLPTSATAPTPSAAGTPDSSGPSPSATTAPALVMASARPREAGAPRDVASPSASSPASGSAAPVLPPVPFRRSSDHYLLASAPGTNCAVNAPCEASMRLEGRGGFHINKEYPYKLVAQSAAGVVFANAGGVFSRQSGDFTEQSENVAVMRVRFTAASPGRAVISGVYNMSVCSATKCDLEKVLFAFEAPIR